MAELKSPYRYFGKKDKVADLIWDHFGEIDCFVEPFFGSGAVLLARPGWTPGLRRLEIVNDKDSHISNFWRALQEDPDAVAKAADWPINETDMHARHLWLVNNRDELSAKLGDPDFYDAKAAGFWVWGISMWLCSGWCNGTGPWVWNENKRIVNKKDRPDLAQPGRSIARKIPNVSSGSFGVHGKQGGIQGVMQALAERMRHVRVCCGDWSRLVEPSIIHNNGVTGLLLDPPYTMSSGRTCDVYGTDDQDVGHAVAEWCRKNQDDPKLKICLCGYEGEYDMPGWIQHAWHAAGGWSHMSEGETQAKKNAKKEMLWFSKSCLASQGKLF